MRNEPAKPAQGFIKTGDLPNRSLDARQKAVLNRKGNEVFNAGDIESARRIFQTTGYGDGLSRVGDRYLAANRFVDALRMYALANDEKKKAGLVAKMARVIHALLREEETE